MDVRSIKPHKQLRVSDANSEQTSYNVHLVCLRCSVKNKFFCYIFEHKFDNHLK